MALREVLLFGLIALYGYWMCVPITGAETGVYSGGNGTLGDVCDDDGDCAGNHTICQCYECVCDPAYKKHYGMCVKYLGSPCQKGQDDECEEIVPHAVCDTETLTCSCKENYTQPTETSCVRGIGDPCKDPDDPCHDVGWSTACHNGTCDCFNSSFLALPSKDACKIPTYDLGSVCNQNNDRCGHHVNHSHCDPARNICACAEEYTKVDDSCVRGIGNPCSNELGHEDPCYRNGTETQCEGKVCKCMNDTSQVVLPDNSTCLTRVDHLGCCCHNTVQCMIENTKCSFQRCECKDGYLKFNDTFCGRAISDPCNTEEPFCPDVENSYCKRVCKNGTTAALPAFLQYLSENDFISKYSDEPTCEKPCIKETCECMDEFTASNSKKRCLPLSKVWNSECEEDQQCTIPWGAKSHCKNKICSCRYRYVFDGQKCVFGITDLGAQCSEDVQCLVPNSECSEGKCCCQRNFEEILNSCIAKLEIPCETPDDCRVANSTCRGGICVCKQNYTKITISSCGRGIGDPCDDDTDPCADTANATCMNSTCQCHPDFVPNTGHSLCLPISDAINSSCEVAEQCTERWGENSMCSGGICQCAPGFTNSNVTCLEKVPRLHMTCDVDGQCSVRRSVCDVESNTCRCARAFTEFNSSFCGRGISNGCSSEDVCDTIESSCPYGWCVCKTDLVPSSNYTLCLNQSYIDGPCVDPGQCKKSLGEGSTCSDGKCGCLDNYKYNQTTCSLYVSKLCLPCNEQTQSCYLEKSGGFQRTRCKDGLCQCKEHYTPSSDRLECIPDSSSALGGCLLLVVTALILTSLQHKPTC